jgi:hypothetical protein
MNSVNLFLLCDLTMLLNFFSLKYFIKKVDGRVPSIKTNNYSLEENSPLKLYLGTSLKTFVKTRWVSSTSHGTIDVTILVRSLYIRDSRHIH